MGFWQTVKLYTSGVLLTPKKISVTKRKFLLVDILYTITLLIIYNILMIKANDTAIDITTACLMIM